MKTQTATARAVGIKKDGKLTTLLKTSFLGMIPVFESHGYTFTGFNRDTTSRAELQGVPKFADLIGPMWDGGDIRYETAAAYADISKD
jgi:hypothetical protein